MPVSGYNAPVVSALSNYAAPVVPATGTPSWNTYGMNTGSALPGVTGGTTAGYPVQQTNIADIPNMQTLTQTINALNLAAQNQANMGRIPGQAGLEQQSSGMIGQELAGQVPSDVMNLLRQQGAEGNVVSGRDSQAAYLNALGRTSLQQQQAGQQNLSQAAARNPVAPIYDPSKLLITPYQQSQLNIEQGQLQLEANRQAMARGGGAGGGGGYGPYSGTGGTAMGPLTPTSSGMGNLLFPSGGGTGSAADLNYIDQPYQDWLDALYSGSGSSVDTPTVDQMFPGLGVEQNLPPDWQAGMQLPEYSNADLADLEQLYGAG